MGTSIGRGSFIVTCNTCLRKSGLPGTAFSLLQMLKGAQKSQG